MVLIPIYKSTLACAAGTTRTNRSVRNRASCEGCCRRGCQAKSRPMSNKPRPPQRTVRIAAAKGKTPHCLR